VEAEPTGPGDAVSKSFVVDQECDGATFALKKDLEDPVVIELVKGGSEVTIDEDYTKHIEGSDGYKTCPFTPTGIEFRDIKDVAAETTLDAYNKV